MKRIKAKIKAKITNHIEKKQQTIKKALLTPAVLFISIAFALALGYGAGIYHYQI